MASDPSFNEPGPPDGGRGPSRISPVRAVLVLAVFVVAVVTLVSVGSRPSVLGDTAPVVVTTTTAVSHHGGSATTTTTVPRSSVSVLVANATAESGLAAHYSTILAAQGWAMKTPLDAATTVATSAVYYAAGQQEAAAAIATSLGLQPHAVLPLTTSVPVAQAGGNDVVVVIGADLVTQAGT
jgi:LytR cell envelope-related transcriptional attenuator